MTQENKYKYRAVVFKSKLDISVLEDVDMFDFSNKDDSPISNVTLQYGQTGYAINRDHGYCHFTPDGSTYSYMIKRRDIWTDEQGYQNGLST